MTNRNAEAFRKLVQAHRGADIFVIGAGGSLRDHLPYLDFALSDNVVIGVNRTCYATSLTYFISAYLSEIYLAVAKSNRTIAFHCRPHIYQPPNDSIISVRRSSADNFDAVDRMVDLQEPTLVTRSNVFFLASHLAIVLGAARIIYIGFDMNNKAHFYNYDEELKKKMFEDIVALQPLWHQFGADHPYESPYEMMKALFADHDSLESSPFYVFDHAPYISKFVGRARELGVEMLSCSESGVLNRIGLRHFNLQEKVAEKARAADGRKGSSISGYVDTITRTDTGMNVVGWAADLHHPQTKLSVIAIYGGKLIANTYVDRQRPDVSSTFSFDENIKSGFELTIEQFSGDPAGILFYAVAASGGCFKLVMSTTRIPHD